ncbi:MAG TPA: cache domain-containing protein [Candidatus Krumholzibacteria bacterium]|nr:cache domain-containing protein [Candidatus Krumholzibacteria bacterium]
MTGRWPGPVLIAAILLLGPARAAAPDAGLPPALEAETYSRLDAARVTRRHDLETYLDRIGALARAVPGDPVMRRYFLLKQRYHELARREAPPAEAVAAIEELKASIRQHYFEHYHPFYDILFVDRGGFVFSTIRMQGDYHRDLFSGDLRDTALGRRLLETPDEAFIDYEYYAVSDEPSAFFVEPMIEDGEHRGWFVMQCAVNKINRIFARDAGLGATGEVFLVNRQHQMLTDSRLRPEPSILRRHLSRGNIEAKFAERKGHKVVTDYRGYRALTSFEVCPVMGTEWLLIAKIDEDEVVTGAFAGDRDRLLRALPRLAAAGAPPACEPPPGDAHPVVVDLDEFGKGLDGRTLATYGVNTCTAVVLTLPGRFSYLGHASPYDAMYGQAGLDMLPNVAARIRTFEMVPWEQRTMQVLLVAPHAESLAGAVDRLLAQGFLLSQIRFVHAVDARSATVVHDPASGATWVGWEPDDPARPARWQRADQWPTLGELVARDLTSAG